MTFFPPPKLPDFWASPHNGCVYSPNEGSSRALSPRWGVFFDVKTLSVSLNNAVCRGCAVSGDIYLNSQVVGRVANGIYYRRAKRSTHFYRKLKGWAFAVETLAQAHKLGAHTVELTDVENNKRYHAALSDFDRHGVYIHYPGWTEQVVLSERFWREVGQLQQPAQLALFQLAGV